MRLPLLGLLASALFVAGCATVRPEPPETHRVMLRTEWGAAEPVLAMVPHAIRQITVHHTATDQQPDRPLAEKLLALQQFSQEEASLGDGRTKRAWADIPYHFYIAPDGTIAEARHVLFAGDTNTAYDPSGHALVVLEGNFEHEPVPSAQWASLVWLTRQLARQWDVPAEAVSGHRDHAATLCPGEGLYRLLPDLRRAVSEP